MARILKYIFPAVDGFEICKTQSQLGAGPVILNGTLVNPITGKVKFTDYGYSKNVIIGSTVDLSAIQFTVVGTQNGTFVSEIIDGPASSSAFSIGKEIFDEIISITTNAQAINFYVGAGVAGFFNPININLQRDVINYVITLGTLTQGNTPTAIPARIYIAYDDITNNRIPFKTQLAPATPDTNTSIFELVDLDENAPPYSINITSPARSILVVFFGEEAHLDNAMQLNFIQT
jgi:hypothetical protein